MIRRRALILTGGAALLTRLNIFGGVFFLFLLLIPSSLIPMGTAQQVDTTACLLSLLRNNVDSDLYLNYAEFLVIR